MSLNITTVEVEAKGFFHTVVARLAVLVGEVGAFIKHALLVLKGDVIIHVIVPIEKRLGSLQVTATVAPASPAPTVNPVTS